MIDTANDSRNDESSSTLDDLIAENNNAIPELQQHAIDAYRDQETSNVETKKHLQNDVFDPELHSVDKNGEPSRLKSGKYRYKKGIQKQYQESANNGESDSLVHSMAAAETVQSLKRLTYDKICEFQYSDTLHKTHVVATAEYFESFGGVKLTPLQSLLILEGTMAIRLTQTPKSKSKFVQFKGWLASKLVKLKGKKRAQSHRRSNPVGQNNTSNDISDEEKTSDQ